MFVQWRPTNRMEATIRAVMPHVVVWRGMLVVGSNEPIAIDREAAMALIDRPDIAAAIKLGGVNLEELRSWIIKSTSAVAPTYDVAQFADQYSGLNYDLFPRDEYFLNNFAGPMPDPNQGILVDASK